MRNAVLIGAVAIAITGSSTTFAQQIERETERRPSPTAQEDRGGWSDRWIASRLASLRGRLQLTPDQEKNWPAYESALQALVKQRRERMQAWHEQGRPTDPVERMRRRADALSSMGTALSRLAEAEGPLYSSLNEDQKRRFATLSQVLGDDGWHRRWRGREDDDDRRGWRDRDDDDDRRTWAGRRSDEVGRGWRDRGDEDRRARRGSEEDDDRREWRGRWRDDDRRGWDGRSGDADRGDLRDHDDYDDDDDDDDDD
jgi:hypothetical protein